MTTIQVLPHELKAGDRITLPCTIRYDNSEGDISDEGTRVFCLPDDDSQGGFTYYAPSDQPLTVDRPDPDADLIEAMARAIVDSDVLDWDELPERDMLGYRANARSALAALREYEAGA